MSLALAMTLRSECHSHPRISYKIYLNAKIWVVPLSCIPGCVALHSPHTLWVVALASATPSSGRGMPIIKSYSSFRLWFLCYLYFATKVLIILQKHSQYRLKWYKYRIFPKNILEICRKLHQNDRFVPKNLGDIIKSRIFAKRIYKKNRLWDWKL